MLSIPIPYFSALLLVLLLALLLRQRGDMRTMVFVAITAAMAGLVGLRWSFLHPYLWLAVALISSVQAPCASRGTARNPRSPIVARSPEVA